MPERTCVLCPLYRPDAEPRLPHRPPVCDGDRWRIDRELAALNDMHHRLSHPDPIEPDPAGVKAWPDGTRQPHHDPVGNRLPVGAVPSRHGAPPVSGSREHSAPVSLDTADLTSPVRPGSVDVLHRPGGDAIHQVGWLSTATILDYWVREWRALLWPDHTLPPGTVPALTRWLRDRADTACDQYPDIHHFAANIHDLCSALRLALGETTPRPEQIHGVACRKCDQRALIRRPGDTYRAECGACGLLFTEEEWTQWLGIQAGYERSTRPAEEIAALMRGRRPKPPETAPGQVVA